MNQYMTNEQFFAKHTKQGECWLWAGCTEASGYGRARFQGKTRRVHVIAYTLAHGPVPAGAVVRHTCDNRACMNPAHLIIGTQSDNVQDMLARGRNRGPGCKGRTDLVVLGRKV